MNEKPYKRFEKLMALNIEGSDTAQENLELWRLMKANSYLKKEFLQARGIHYLCKVLCDPAATETAFVNRVTNALHPGRLCENEFTAAVQKRLIPKNTTGKYSPWRFPALRFAASVIILFAGMLAYHYGFFQTQTGKTELAVSENLYLSWDFDKHILKAKHHLTRSHPTKTANAYFNCWPDNSIRKNIAQANQLMARSEHLWPLASPMNRY